MSKKQEIYREILKFALIDSRMTLSQFNQVRCWRVLSRKQQRHFQASYELAQLVHNLYVSILVEDFTFHDIWFLNFQARLFIERNNDKTCYLYSLFAYYIQELFKTVPDTWKDQLEWKGPQGDYDWARPKSGYEA